ncbi:MAG: hypothetical protein Tsb0013_13070 [Phycisphaerales bacterium]
MPTRLGEILVDQGVLREEQVEAILEAQQACARPFGVLAEELFGICPEAIERAWVRQYIEIAQHVDVLTVPRDPGIGAMVSSRQCWQFGVFPIREEGRELVMATTPGHLPRALRFASSVLERPCYFVLTAQDALARALEEHHAIPGLDATHLASTALAA